MYVINRSMCNKNISQIVLNCYWKHSQILSYYRFYGNMYSRAILTNFRHHIVNLTITVPLGSRYICAVVEFPIVLCFLEERKSLSTILGVFVQIVPILCNLWFLVYLFCSQRLLDYFHFQSILHHLH